MRQLQITKLENYFFIKPLGKLTDPLLLPRVAEYLYKIKDERIIDINASNAELLIHTEELQEKQVHLLVDTAIRKIETQKQILHQSIELPICYELGTDWAEVEDQIGLSREDYIDLLTKLQFKLAMFGFIPGFSYLSGLPTSMHCKRKNKPSKKIEANTLALGGSYIGIYGLESPGGWLDIGRCTYNLTRIPEGRPHILNFATSIKFIPISIDQYQHLIQNG